MSKNIATTLSLLALSTGLVSHGGAFALDGAVKATTKWTVGRVASVTQGSYCTMAQKYSDASVLTLAKNARGEYSLAVDFADPQFKANEKLKVGLAAQGGSKETFSVTPQSAKTVVVGLGKDAALVASLKKIGELVVTVGSETQNFSVANYAAGLTDLETCITGLGATPQAKTADLETSEKIGVTSPKPEVTKNVMKIEADTSAVAAAAEEPFQKKYPKIDVNAEGLLAAKPTPSDSSEVVDSEFVPVPVQHTGQAAATVAAVVADAPSKAEVAASQSRIDELQKKLDMALVQNQALTTKLQEVEGTAQKPSAPDADKMSQLARDIEMSRQGLEATKAELAAAKAENETLRNQLKMAATKSQASVTTASAASQDQMAALSAQNKELMAQLDQMKAKASQVSSEEPAAGEDKLRDEVRDLRLQVQTISAERAALEARIENFQKDAEHSQLKMAGGSWDLEQATRRYQESQREIRRLGAMVDEQKIKCQEEKKEIEYKLFDPAIASTEQIAMLDKLEDAVAEKEATIKKIQLDMAQAQNTPSPQLAKDMADLKAALAAREQEVVTFKGQIETLKNEMAQQKGLQSASYEEQLNKSQQELALAQKQLAEKNAQMASLEKQVADLQTAPQVAAVQPIALSTAEPSAGSGFQQASYSSQSAAVYPSKQDIAELLSRSGVSVSGSIKVVEGDSPDYRAYSWSSQGLFGSTEIRYVPGADSYSDIVSGYLARAKSRCDGEFAAIPSKVSVSGAAKSSGYEIACVGGSDATSASVLFSSIGDIVTTVAHEGQADLMDQAIDVRDRIASHLN